MSKDHWKLSQNKLCGLGQKVSEYSLIKISGFLVKFIQIWVKKQVKFTRFLLLSKGWCLPRIPNPTPPLHSMSSTVSIYSSSKENLGIQFLFAVRAQNRQSGHKRPEGMTGGILTQLCWQLDQMWYERFLVVMCIWWHLKMTKSSGQAYDLHGLEMTKPGSCAVECPACPQPSWNLLLDYGNAPPALQYVYMPLWVHSLQQWWQLAIHIDSYSVLIVDTNFQLKQKNKMIQSSDQVRVIGCPKQSTKHTSRAMVLRKNPTSVIASCWSCEPKFIARISGYWCGWDSMCAPLPCWIG